MNPMVAAVAINRFLIFINTFFSQMPQGNLNFLLGLFLLLSEDNLNFAAALLMIYERSTDRLGPGVMVLVFSAEASMVRVENTGDTLLLLKKKWKNE